MVIELAQRPCARIELPTQSDLGRQQHWRNIRDEFLLRHAAAPLCWLEKAPGLG
jgi:hypothetical protein